MGLRYIRPMRRLTDKEPPRFDMLYRTNALRKMSAEGVDVLVIGGGITGAGIALDAASRGLKVGLLEKNDFASGTSSRSTKLIHGGLRYLKNGEIGLVREVGKERQIVFSNAPHLVKPMPILLPLRASGSLKPFMTSVALWMYDRLANVQKSERRRMLSAHAVSQQEPCIKVDDLLGGGLYVEYRTDDARLTLEIIKTANAFGAHSVNYAGVKGFLYGANHLGDNQVTGVRLFDHIHQQEIAIQAGVVVNACGPWVDSVRKGAEAITGKKLVLTKGVHIVVPQSRLPVQQILYFDVPDGRMVFAIPRGTMTYVGTTDTVHDQLVDDPVATQEDIDYLLKAANAMFPDAGLSAADVQTTWAGLRPLIFEPGKGPSELSRRDELFVSSNGLVSIAGGKLTGYRKMAERVMDVVMPRLSKDTQKKSSFQCVTENIALGSQPFARASQVEQLIAELDEHIDHDHGPVGLAEEWVRRYGAEARSVFQEARKQYGDSFDGDAGLRAELRHALSHEMVIRPTDFWVRRTGMLYFNPGAITPDRIDWVVEEMKASLGEGLLDWEKEKQEVHDLLESHWAKTPS